MTDLLQQGATFLDGQRHAHMTRVVVYVRGAESKEVHATVGRTEFEQADEVGLIHRTESRDFLVRAADLDFGSGPVLPRAGDRVRETQDGRTFVYEVNAPGGEPPWRFSDPYRRVLRVHTTFTGTEA